MGNISSLFWQKQGKIDKIEDHKGIDIGVVQDFLEEILAHEVDENIGENVLDFETDIQSRGDSFTDVNLNLSLDILHTETGEAWVSWSSSWNWRQEIVSNCVKVCIQKVARQDTFPNIAKRPLIYWKTTKKVA